MHGQQTIQNIRWKFHLRNFHNCSIYRFCEDEKFGVYYTRVRDQTDLVFGNIKLYIKNPLIYILKGSLGSKPKHVAVMVF
jgi:hypothetical protein